MEDLIPTIGIAFIFIVLAIAALSIGWLITGRSSIKPGACGQAPKQPKDQTCGGGKCDLCSKDKE